MGYIYIMTNPALNDMVKIGYATDVEARRQQLSTTALKASEYIVDDPSFLRAVSCASRLLPSLACPFVETLA